MLQDKKKELALVLAFIIIIFYAGVASVTAPAPASSASKKSKAGPLENSHHSDCIHSLRQIFIHESAVAPPYSPQRLLSAEPLAASMSFFGVLIGSGGFVFDFKGILNEKPLNKPDGGMKEPVFFVVCLLVLG